MVLRNTFQFICLTLIWSLCLPESCVILGCLREDPLTGQWKQVSVASSDFVSGPLLHILWISLCWPDELQVHHSVVLLQGLYLLYCLESCSWTCCAFQSLLGLVPFVFCTILLPWQSNRNFHCILIWGEGVSVLMDQSFLNRSHLISVPPLVSRVKNEKDNLLSSPAVEPWCLLLWMSTQC